MSLIKTGPLAHFDCGEDCEEPMSNNPDELIGTMGVFRAYGGEEITRRIVDVSMQHTKDGPALVAYICRPEEYAKARLEQREPVTVGFRMSDYLRRVDEQS